MERTTYTYHYSIENCIGSWGRSPDASGAPAGRSMAKALNALGMRVNSGSSDRVFVEATTGDSYTLFVKDKETAEKVAAEVSKDARIRSVTVNGEPFTPKADTDLEEFKRQVYKKAMEKARQHGWCDVVQDTLKDLGIEAPKKRLKVVLELDIEDGDSTDKVSTRELVYDLGRDDLFTAIKSIETVEV